MDYARLDAAADRLDNFILTFEQLPKLDPSLRDVVTASTPDLKEILNELREAMDD